MKRWIIFIVFGLLIISCEVAPEKIEYGIDACSFCDMTIVDKTHAAEFVTEKGRIYKFDAIECLINDLSKKNENNLAFILVTDYLNPTEFLNVTEAIFLISEEIKSPMGANLSAFNKNSNLSYQGEMFNWKGIKKRIRK